VRRRSRIWLTIRSQRGNRPHARNGALVGIDHHPDVTAIGVERHYLVGGPASRRRAQRRETGRSHDPRNAPWRHAGQEIALPVITGPIVVDLCGCGAATSKSERGKGEQKCDRFFQGTLPLTVFGSVHPVTDHSRE
jgi:hypothetical protein